MGLLMNDRCDFEPEKISFFVIVSPAAPVQPASAEANARDSHSRVQQRAPRAAWTPHAKGSGDAGKVRPILLRGPQPAPRSQEWAHKIGESFVVPQQIVLHRRFVIGRGQISRAAKLPAPG